MTHSTDEVELLLKNAQLRDELEPYIDESVSLVHFRQMNLCEENSFSSPCWPGSGLQRSLSASGSKPNCNPRPHQLDDDLLSNLLHDTIDRLFSVRIVLEMTDHLSDRELYKLILRDILPPARRRSICRATICAGVVWTKPTRRTGCGITPPKPSGCSISSSIWNRYRTRPNCPFRASYHGHRNSRLDPSAWRRSPISVAG